MGFLTDMDLSPRIGSGARCKNLLETDDPTGRRIRRRCFLKGQHRKHVARYLLRRNATRTSWTYVQWPVPLDAYALGYGATEHVVISADFSFAVAVRRWPSDWVRA